jgi:ATP-dependent DNA ligase
MPRGDAAHGTLLFEPKWDGYRCVAVTDDHGATLWSRQGKELTGYFPELCSMFTEAVPPGCVVDGEAVIWSQGRLNFDALQQRLGAGPRTLPGLVMAAPANYVAFDVLAVAGHDARDLPLSARRRCWKNSPRAGNRRCPSPPPPRTLVLPNSGSKTCRIPGSRAW